MNRVCGHVGAAAKGIDFGLKMAALACVSIAEICDSGLAGRPAGKRSLSTPRPSAGTVGPAVGRTWRPSSGTPVWKSSTSEIAVKHLKAVLVGALTFYLLSSDCLAAAPWNDVRTQTVRFADLDLTRPAGAHELYRRIQQAAREVCEPNGAAGYLAGYQKCLSSAIARALADVGAPLTEHHRAPTHATNLQERQAHLKQ
jgi:UrcA family protein